MNTATIIQQAQQDGVTLQLAAEGIRASGKSEVVAKWLPIFRQQKPVLMSALLDFERRRLMRCMVDWNERAAMMTGGDLTPEQAETAAWHDLGLDAVFFGSKMTSYTTAN